MDVATALTFVSTIDPISAPPPPASAFGGSARLAWAGLSGLLAAATAVGLGHLVASVLQPSASPLLAVGSTFIDLTPEWLKTFAIDTFGERDKLALLVGITVTLAVVAVVIGLISLRSRPLALLGVGAFGLVGAVAAALRPAATIVSPLPSVIGGTVAVVALWALSRRLDGARPSSATARPGSVPADRRSFLVGVASIGVLAAVSGGLGIFLTGRRAAASAGAGFSLPVPMEPAAPIPAGADLHVDGISSFVTSNPSFYRVDTALEVPVVAAADWRLRIHGMVDREVELTLDDLLQLPIIERDITLTCVSNVVGGAYVGNARWLGVSLATVLGLAGVHAGADQIVSTSIDGFTIGTPTAVALDGRDAMLAVAMNGEPLPAEHGYPVRMVVPGLYGYVSATKWVVDLELTTFDAYTPYWVKRDWAKLGPIKTASRIDTPAAFATLPVGTVKVGGVAWAQHTGIAKVEVRADGGEWHAATLGDADGLDTWRQWVYPWDVTAAGHHTLEVRATDAAGQIQTETRAEPFPSGATGWHSVVVTVA